MDNYLVVLGNELLYFGNNLSRAAEIERQCGAFRMTVGKTGSLEQILRYAQSVHPLPFKQVTLPVCDSSLLN